MKVPVFEEIQLNQACSSDYIEEKFSELGVGEIPIVIRTDKISYEDFMETLPHIETAVKNLGIHPRFPYPIVIMTRHIQENKNFLIVQSEEELPKHFNTHTKRLSKKELQALNKLGILREKFKNILSNQSLDEIPSAVKDQRELYILSKELYFYEQLKKRTIKLQEKKNESKKR